MNVISQKEKEKIFTEKILELMKLREKNVCNQLIRQKLVEISFLIHDMNFSINYPVYISSFEYLKYLNRQCLNQK